MPNRKTFDVNDRYDHSSHSTRSTEQGDLQATPLEKLSLSNSAGHDEAPEGGADASLFGVTDGSGSPSVKDQQKKERRTAARSVRSE